jgi:hypothetical protein
MSHVKHKPVCVSLPAGLWRMTKIRSAETGIPASRIVEAALRTQMEQGKPLEQKPPTQK